MGIYTLTVVRGDDRYVFRYTKPHIVDLFDCLMRFAANPTLNLTLEDAAEVIQSIQEYHQCPG
jgi:hypothetical protein